MWDKASLALSFLVGSMLIAKALIMWEQNSTAIPMACKQI